MRVGIGFDAHQFISGRPLILGGVEIPYDKGLKGHSDADVLIHAIIDAMLGAAALGNIGDLFPASDEKYKNISSLLLLKDANELLEKNNYSIINIDSVVILEEPRLENHWKSMQEKITQTLGIEYKKVSLKAKTTEGMGFTGKKEGVGAMATVLLAKNEISNKQNLNSK